MYESIIKVVENISVKSQTYGQSHVKLKAEVEVMELKAKANQGLLQPPEDRKRQRKITPRAFLGKENGSWFGLHPPELWKYKFLLF